MNRFFSSVSTQERLDDIPTTDLGVQVDFELKFQKHNETQVKKKKKASKLVGLIRRSFMYLDNDGMRQD